MKNANKKRKVFDTTKMRVDGTDINLRQAKKAAKQPVNINYIFTLYSK